MQNAITHQFEKVRRYERKPFTQTIDYSVSVSEARERKWLNLKGKAVDISEAGIGIQTDYPLSPGHMLWFNGGIQEKAGFVRWCEKLDNTYRAGVELDGKRIKELDESTDIFNARLEEIEKRCNDQDANPDTILKDISSAFDDVLSACQRFEQETRDITIIRDARRRFHQKTNPILSKSYAINRARTWPLGYQGDYRMLETIYRKTPLSEGIGHYLDTILIESSLAVAVRNRLKNLEDILKNELQKKHGSSVLNIACGSCREVVEISSTIAESAAKFTCIDLDNDALSFAANRLSFTNISPSTSNQVILRKYNAIRMFDHELNMNEFGGQDIIYSVGFFDYLDSDFLTKLIHALYNLLNPGGLLITSFKDAAKYRHQEYHWIVDWDGFLQRDEEDFRTILRHARIPDASISEIREDSDIIVFYLIRK
ncbi:MAG: hypothetical protein AB1552_04235 [Nitrospirota bacterium]